MIVFMTLFGTIWILISIILFFIKDIKPLLLFTILGMIFQCSNVIELSNFSCGPQLLTSLMFILKSFLYKNKSFKLDSFYKLYGIFLIYIILNMILIKYVQNNLIWYFMIIIYFFTAIRIQYINPKIESKFFKKIINILSVTILFFGLIQLIIMFFNIDRNNLFGMLFYNDISKKLQIAYYTTKKIRFYSTFMEPSYLSGLLVGLLYYYLNDTNKTRKECIITFGLFVASILTFSSTAYLLLLCVIVLFLLKHHKSKMTYLIVIPLFIGMSLIMLKTNIINDVLINKMSSGSGVTRNNWNTIALEYFHSSPIFGVGFGTVRASSIICDILGELGIIGLTLYILPFIYLIYNYFKKKENYNYNTLSVMLIIVFGSQIISCPDLHLCSFWLVAYLYSLSSHTCKTGDEYNER